MLKVFYSFLVLAVLSSAAIAQPFYACINFRSAFGFSLDLSIGAGVSLANDRIRLEIETGGFVAAAGDARIFPVLGVKAFVEPVRFDSSGIQVGGGLRTLFREGESFVPTACLRYRSQETNAINIYGVLDLMFTPKTILPQMGVTAEWMLR